MFFGKGGKCFYVMCFYDLICWVFEIEKFCVVKCFVYCIFVVVINIGYVDFYVFENGVEEMKCIWIDMVYCNDVIFRFDEVQDGGGNGGYIVCKFECIFVVFEFCQYFFEYVDCWIQFVGINGLDFFVMIGCDYFVIG